MKHKSVLLFSVVIVSLTFVAIADADEVEIGFTGNGYFDGYYDEETGDQVFFPYGGFDLLDVSPIGTSKVVWELRVDPDTLEFRSGTFTITRLKGKHSLTGYYEGFVIDFTTPKPTYDLEWIFTGGTGRFDDFVGTGHTDGEVDFDTGYAEFVFSGTVTDDDDDQGDDD